MPKLTLQQEDLQKLERGITDKLIQGGIVPKLLDALNLNPIIESVLSKVPTPQDGIPGKDAEVSKEIISEITVKAIEEIQGLIQDGKDGRDGLDGPTGQQGKQGRDGRDGQSVRGLTGRQGPRGINGIPGTQGESGIQGLPGANGNPGTNGTDGNTPQFTDDDFNSIIARIDMGQFPNKKEIDEALKKLKVDLRMGRIELPIRHGGGGGLTGDPLIREINRVVREELQLLNYIFENTTVDDEGIDITGELHVGRYDDGKESVFGMGESHVNGMTVLTTPDDVTFIDVTEIAASAEDSTYELFAGTTVAGAIDYVGSDIPICGIKLKTAVVGDLGAGVVVRETWNGAMWVIIPLMATKAIPPYDTRADSIGSEVGSEHIRFRPCETPTKTTINGIEKYWVRARIVTDITATGETQQIKLHTSRFEVNADGFTEYFGAAIYQKDLLMHWGLSAELVGFSPQNKTIDFASGLSLVYTANQLNDGQTSGRGGWVEIPEGIDTSRLLIGEILFIPLANTAGDIYLEIDTYQTAVGDTLTTANTPNSINQAVSIAAGNENVLHRILVPVGIETLIPGEILAFGFKRIGADALDTFSGAIAIVNIRATGSFWKP